MSAGDPDRTMVERLTRRKYELQAQLAALPASNAGMPDRGRFRAALAAKLRRVEARLFRHTQMNLFEGNANVRLTGR